MLTWQVLNDVIWPAKDEGWLSVAVLPPLTYVNGFRFFEGRGMPTCRGPPWCVPLAPHRIIALHHNWVRGDATKGPLSARL